MKHSCCDITEGVNEEFWGLVNPMMFILADILDQCISNRGPLRHTEDYLAGWNDLADNICQILCDEGLLEEVEKLIQ